MQLLSSSSSNTTLSISQTDVPDRYNIATSDGSQMIATVSDDDAPLMIAVFDGKAISGDMYLTIWNIVTRQVISHSKKTQLINVGNPLNVRLAWYPSSVMYLVRATLQGRGYSNSSIVNLITDDQ